MINISSVFQRIFRTFGRDTWGTCCMCKKTGTMWGFCGDDDDIEAYCKECAEKCWGPL